MERGSESNDSDSLAVRLPKSSEPLKYVLRVSGFETLEDEAFTVYFVRVSVESHQDALRGKPRMWYIRKRYRDFWNLRQRLLHVDGDAPDLPEKKYFGNTDPEFLKLRARGLSKFLWSLAISPRVCAIKCVHEFLWTDLCVPSTRGMLPSTPLLGPSSTSSLVAQPHSMASFDLSDESFNEAAYAAQEQLGEEDLIMQASSDIADANGRMVLTSCEDLQRSFAEEGIFFPEDDIVESDGNESDLDDGYLGKACAGFMPGLYKWYSGNEEEEVLKRRASRTSSDGSSQLAASTNGFDVERRHNLEKVSYSNVNAEDDDAFRKKIVPKLRFVIILVGSRGDVQPYVALGIALARRGHYVRVAAHECFRDFVTSNDLGFAPLAGDPKDLMRMVTENSMFSFQFVKQGLTTHRAWIHDLLEDAWDACTLPAEDLRRADQTMNVRAETDRNVGHGPGFAFTARHSSFRADAIIANPPAFSGWHIAEALGVPLYMSFPMPWSRTGSFPSPFTSARGKSPSTQLNWMSYGAVDRLIWLGSGDIINSWRMKTLRLDPIWTLSARGHRIVHDNKVPFLYPWSPQVLPKPKDWGSHICIPGYWFLDDEQPPSTEYIPDERLSEFLRKGEPPIYIGFGSIVVNNPEKLSQTILQTVTRLSNKGHRFIIQAGWSGMNVAEAPGMTDDVARRILQIGPAPHRWLFERCKCLVHHGGAGTTAEGIRAGKPSVVVPFFGDQFFWARQVKEARIGTRVRHAKLTSDLLCEGIECALGSGMRMRAQVLGASVSKEQGTKIAIAFIERHFLNIEFTKGMQVLVQNPKECPEYWTDDNIDAADFW
eukprot:CAMPEP_0203757774 /NCGR_PEP_ID=MMETSP0098-20131031/10679_1 /ASSEMBLY_ACC=CAM_ASM_000208 /TAXON_ID=96639 /ORGANISM=" , Strain NY0313808BC1" /LENGTH=825 /DNA_ID=CAMNT_0050650005 /DNA_START=372 /DNA_END=2846 /DNA_ORIENTATION=-